MPPAQSDRVDPLVVGANHRSSSAALRDRLFVPDDEAPRFLAGLRSAGVGQALVLSTCDRVEVQAVHPDADAAAAVVAHAFAERAGAEADGMNGQLYTLVGGSALHHIFSVAASLESQVIGEPNVFGQVKASHRLARDHGMSGPELERVLQAAYAAAKRVRTETAIGERPVSIAAAASALARDVHGDLAGCTALLLGGEMAELIAEHLIAAGLGRLLVAAPAARQAEEAARRFDCHIVPFDRFAATLAEADIVLAGLGSRQYVIGREMVEQALKRRRRRPIFLVDAAVPGDIAPEVHRIDEAFLYDLADLERVALAGRANREAAAEEARAIVAAEVAAFARLGAERRAAPAVVTLRERFEAARRQALAEAGNDAERATRLLVNRLLHAPTAALRDLAGRGADAERAAAEDMLRRLFGGRPGDEEDKR